MFDIIYWTISCIVLVYSSSKVYKSYKEYKQAHLIYLDDCDFWGEWVANNDCPTHGLSSKEKAEYAKKRGMILCEDGKYHYAIRGRYLTKEQRQIRRNQDNEHVLYKQINGILGK